MCDKTKETSYCLFFTEFYIFFTKKRSFTKANPKKEYYILIFMKCNQSITLYIVFCLSLWHINLSRLFNAKCIFIQINISISNNTI